MHVCASLSLCVCEHVKPQKKASTECTETGLAALLCSAARPGPGLTAHLVINAEGNRNVSHLREAQSKKIVSAAYPNGHKATATATAQCRVRRYP